MSSRVRRLLARLAALTRAVRGDGRYRPEVHYMRGPGPKTLAKKRSMQGTSSR